ncbi:hypothetical protein BZA77DRAFT_273118 [Pyronema omphalodes]|nr:hypothetical protein BZA77DRAFT_273118 [Pyronema omphalodes]
MTSTTTAPPPLDPKRACANCHTSRAKIKRAKTDERLCIPCFLLIFETEIHETIISSSLFRRGQRVAIGASGGKDSTVLAAVLKTLNERYDYGVTFVLLSIDEGIKGYRDDSLETVKRNAEQYGMELKIVGYRDLYGWTMDQVVERIGKKGNCTVCGVFRRQALDRGAGMLGVGHVVTGHNADDMAETVLMNLLRGDLPRLHRCTCIVTESSSSPVSRSKPLKYAYEKEIVLYAHHRKLDYFSTECIYSPEAFRGSARSLIKSLERVRPSAILDIVRSGEAFAEMVPEEIRGSACAGEKKTVDTTGKEEEEQNGCGKGPSQGGEMSQFEKQLQENEKAQDREVEITIPPSSVPSKEKKKTPTPTKATKVTKKQQLGQCRKCGYMSSQELCKACVILDDLNKNRPKIEVVLDEEDEDASSSVRRKMEAIDIKSGVEI